MSENEGGNLFQHLAKKKRPQSHRWDEDVIVPGLENLNIYSRRHCLERRVGLLAFTPGKCQPLSTVESRLASRAGSFRPGQSSATVADPLARRAFPALG
jgi:hypothetical protein